MRFTKPAWVMHKDSAKSDQNTKRVSIFSISVHPDGSRIATGGLDAKIRIWSTKPILNQAAELSGKPPKSLCTLTMHSGPVLVVRWAHSGRWLASGSDDQTVMVWDHDPSARGKVWGSDDVNVEGWKALKRLPGHDSDVVDVAWAPGDRYLASVGLDSAVVIWCGFTLDRLRKLDQHQGFVKGVCWDPVGEFLATQSDDRTVKIWKTADWSLEAEVTKPFEDSPGSTFFRRLSWSPDGAHITASNATNNKGYVFIAAVIARTSWSSEISLVGHENTVEVASYNPHIFLRDPSSPVSTSNICSVVALGADDRSVSVWQTKSARPLIVAKEVFERQIMDLSWSLDGLILYACSSDGTIAAFQFEPSELEGIASKDDQEQYLAKFNYIAAPIPEGYSHTSKDEPQKETPVQTNGFVVPNNPQKVNVLVAKKKQPKRIGLAQPNNPAARIPSSSSNHVIPHSHSNGTLPKRAPLVQLFEANPHPASLVSRSDSFPDESEQPFGDPSETWSRRGDIGQPMEMDVPISTFSTSSSKGKRKISLSAEDGGAKVRARTLGGDRPVEHHVAKEITSWTKAPPSSNINAVGNSPSTSSRPSEVFAPLPLLTYLSTEAEGSGHILEAKNREADGTTELALLDGTRTEWLDYLPSPAIALTATSCFSAVAMQDGCVIVYSPTGRRIMPTLSLGSQCSILASSKNALLAVTTQGLIYSWDIKKQAAHFSPVSIQNLYALSPNISLSSATVRENGTPILSCSNGVVYSYDSSLLAFTKLADRWWAEGSDFWQGRQSRSSNSLSNRGILTSIESSITSSHDSQLSAAEKPRPDWWTDALTLGHLETRLHAAKVLDSPQEYRQALLMYAKKIADEGFKGKAEELVKEMFGPVYWRPRRDDSWCSTVAGLAKRDLVKDVLAVFARSKTLSSLAAAWQETLKKATNDDFY